MLLLRPPWIFIYIYIIFDGSCVKLSRCSVIIQICLQYFSIQYVSDMITQIMRRKKNPPKKREKLHKCEECSFHAHKKDIVRTHVNKVHRKLKNFQCADCNHSTYDNSSLQVILNMYLRGV